MSEKKRYPFSLKEHGDSLEHAKSVLCRSKDPYAAEKIRKINEILKQESPCTPNTAWLTGPELGFAKKVIEETLGIRIER